MRFCKAHLLLVVVVLLGGCAFTPYQPLDSASRQKIKTIALIGVTNPPEYQVTNFSSPALLFGALGGAVAGASMESRSSALDKMLRGAGFDYGARMEKALTEALEQAGYKVVHVTLARPNERKFVEDYSAMRDQQVEAVLDTSVMGVGYFDVNFTDSALRPTVNIQTQLLSWPDRQTLFSETILFGYRNPLISDTHIPAPGAYRYNDFESVLNNKERSIQGLELAITSVASHIAQRLGGSPRAKHFSSAHATQTPAANRAATGRETAAALSNPDRQSPENKAQASSSKFGKSSYVVEKMAKANGCQGGTGAYLTTEPGPVESYRVTCESDFIFMARCEYGVCTQQK